MTKERLWQSYWNWSKRVLWRISFRLLKTHADNNRTDGEFHAKGRVFLYADDVFMFLHLVAMDIDLGLEMNIRKSSVTPIRCSTEELDLVQWHTRARFLSCLANMLVYLYQSGSWPKPESSLSLIISQTSYRDGKLTLWIRLDEPYKSWIASMVIYVAMALKVMDKIRRGLQKGDTACWLGRK